MSFDRHLTDLLRSRDISASELARNARVSKQTVSDWLQGMQPRNLIALKRVATYFELSLDELLFPESIKPGLAPSRRNLGSADSLGIQSMTLALQELVFSANYMGRILAFSAGWQNRLGWEASRLEGCSLYSLIHWEDLARLFRTPWMDRRGSESQLRVMDHQGNTPWLTWQIMTLPHDAIVLGVCIPMDNPINIKSPIESLDIALITSTMADNLRIREPRQDIVVQVNAPTTLHYRGHKDATAQAMSSLVWELFLLATDSMHMYSLGTAGGTTYPRIVMSIQGTRRPVFSVRLDLEPDRKQPLTETPAPWISSHIASLGGHRVECLRNESSLIYSLLLT